MPEDDYDVWSEIIWENAWNVDLEAGHSSRMTPFEVVKAWGPEADIRLAELMEERGETWSTS